MENFCSNLFYKIEIISPDEIDHVSGGTNTPPPPPPPPTSGGRVVGTIDPETGKVTYRCLDGQDPIVTQDGDRTIITCP